MQNENVKQESKKNIILWAIDPTQKPQQAKELVRGIKSWAQKLNCEIQPITIFSKSVLNFPMELALPWAADWDQVMMNSVKKYLKGAGLANTLPPVILNVPVYTNRGMAEALAKYAKKMDAMMIAANTKGHRMLVPFYVGSFVEALTVFSQVPLLLFSPKSKSVAKPRVTFFPTDFSRSSKNALTQFIPWGLKRGGKVVLYNRIESPIFPATPEGISVTSASEIDRATREVEKMRVQKMQDWSAWLKEEGLRINTQVVRQHNFLDTEILKDAKRANADLIVMTHSGSLTSESVLGSAAREVLLRATCPVLVFHKPVPAKEQAVVQTKTFTEGKQNDAVSNQVS